jgi:uroporphyrinogen decarboxylase
MAHLPHRLLAALKRQPVDRTPVWIMRQAGRYLPEYRATRAQAGSFMQLCKNPELATEVTLQPLARFDLDAAIIFSDILTIPDAMGLGLSFTTGEGPTFAHPIRNNHDIDKLYLPDPENELRYVMDAIRLTKQALANRVPLIGFAGSPWTLACYMVEGGASKNFGVVKGLLFNEPASMHQLLQLLADAASAYLSAQIKAGADVVMLFDTWGGILAPHHYREFSLRYMQMVVHYLQQAHADTPVILFTKGGGAWLADMAATGATALGLDWTTDLSHARAQVGDQVALQGNLDPCLLYATPNTIRAAVQQTLQSFGAGSGHIFNLGHGILPDVDPLHLATLINAVHEFSPAYHRAIS